MKAGTSPFDVFSFNTDKIFGKIAPGNTRNWYFFFTHWFSNNMITSLLLLHNSRTTACVCPWPRMSDICNEVIGTTPKMIRPRRQHRPYLNCYWTELPERIAQMAMFQNPISHCQAEANPHVVSRPPMGKNVWMRNALANAMAAAIKYRWSGSPSPSIFDDYEFFRIR